MPRIDVAQSLGTVRRVARDRKPAVTGTSMRAATAGCCESAMPIFVAGAPRGDDVV
jgi:hypothetical protein